MSINNFSELALRPDTMRAIEEMGFETPTPIQSEAIPYILEGHDIIGQAQTGTGKTLAFALPAIEKIPVTAQGVQILVLCPTRELAVQVCEEFKKLCRYHKTIFALPIYGGDSITKQISYLRKGVQIVVGTPGRVIDHIERGTLKLNDLKMIVLDEADEMLNMGFIDDIKMILERVPETRQTIFFSATMPDPILALTRQFQNNPKLVKVTKKEVTNDMIEQLCFEVRNEHKFELMSRLITMHEIKLGLIFCNTKQGVDDLVIALQEKGISAEGLHGDMRQEKRDNVMGRYRKGSVAMLVATDVASRGIDVDNIEAVFNFDVPLDPEYYVHRIGRTGRAGKTGKAFTFITPREFRRVRDIEQFTKVRMQKGEIPTINDIQKIKREQITSQIISTLESQKVAKHTTQIFQNLTEMGIDVEQIALTMLDNFIGKEIPQGEDKLLMAEKRKGFENQNDRYERSGGRNDRGGNERGGDRNSRYSNDKGEKSGYSNDRGDRGNRTERNNERNNANMVRLFINLGKNQRVSKGDILGAITGESNVAGNQIGAIDIYDGYTFVDVSKNIAQDIIFAMNNNKIKGKRVNVEFAN
jgi:ATP-dependent RNA helicase DeaD